MTKIVHLSTAHRPSDTRIFRKECRTLVGAGYEVVLIVPHGTRRRAAEEIVEGVRIRGVPPPAGRIERICRTTWQVYRAAVDEDAALYHVHDPELLGVARLLRRRGKRVVFDMHENLPEDLLTKRWIPPRLRRTASHLARLAGRALLDGIAIVFAETSYVDNHRWVGRHEVVLNMPLIDELRRERSEPYPTPTLGYIGVVGPEHGSTATIRALAILKRRGRAAEFECIGPIADRHRRELLRQSGRLGLSGVRLRGYMPPGAGWRRIARCHVGLAVLRPEPNLMESFPTKMFEYMALGIPVVASDFPLYRRVVEGAGCGLCVDPDDPQQIADAVAWLLGHPREAAAMGRRGRQAVNEQYNWEIEAEKLLQFYAIMGVPKPLAASHACNWKQICRVRETHQCG
jgi:glycosyltransferase involved in cell wall biosynthesis